LVTEVYDDLTSDGPKPCKFLADRVRTNGRAYATMLRPSVCLSVLCNVYVLWLNGASLSKST